MKILYSGATNYMTVQRDFNKSLGGFMSSTQIPNKRLNALFPEISNYNLAHQNTHTLAVFLFNDSGKKIENLSMDFIRKKIIKDNLCDFEFALNDPSENGSIELIGSIYEEPFSVEWFKCQSIQDSGVIKVTKAGKTGDLIQIFNLQGYVVGNSIEDTQNSIVDLINESNFIEALKLPDGEIYIQTLEIGVNTEPDSDFVTNGEAEIKQDITLSGGVDDKVILPEILPNKSLGLWIKRTINKDFKKQSKECVDLSIENIDNVENVDIVFNFDEVNI